MKNILLGVTGGIAAYKAAELARLCIRGGAAVQVVMTPAALNFITPLTFQTITGRPVPVESFTLLSSDRVRHIELAAEADVMVVAPASANTLAKMANGIADNLLTTIFLAAACPVVLVPSMNERMLEHPAVLENLERLRRMGCHLMEPDAGDLACGVIGKGRMPEPADILNFMRAALTVKDLVGVKALVTAGPTRELLDPVRFISNPSSGLMGYALARSLAARGADVVLVSGPSHLSPPAGVKFVPVITAEEMHRAVLEHYPPSNLVIKAAAVSDYRPERTEPRKVKKNEGDAVLTLVRTPDILKEVGRSKGNRILVGFAAETDSPVQHAREKLIEKNLDLVVVNDITVNGAGFACETNKVCIIDSREEVEELPLMEKEALADHIAGRVAALWAGR